MKDYFTLGLCILSKKTISYMDAYTIFNGIEALLVDADFNVNLTL